MPRSRKKRPKAMRVRDLVPRWYRLQETVRVVEDGEVSQAKKLSRDPLNFFRQVVGFEPTKYQKELINLFLKCQFVAARWCRQSGKSWIVASLLLWYAVTHSDSCITVVAPSLRQAKFIIRRIAYFLKKLPPGMYFKPLRTVLRFTNGSVIEAFPNNPDTIRGPTLHVVYCDEMNFLPNDEEMYDRIKASSVSDKILFLCGSGRQYLLQEIELIEYSR